MSSIVKLVINLNVHSYWVDPDVEERTALST